MKSKNIEFQSVVRPNIWNLQPYSSARSEKLDYLEKQVVLLDANENPFGEYNRYCDPYQSKVKQILSKVKQIPQQNIFLSNGSDEVIDLAFRIFCQPLVDKAVVLRPSYGMYKVYGDIHQTPIVEVNLEQDFSLSDRVVQEVLQVQDAKLLFICQVNNPTGNLLDTDLIQKLIQEFQGIVILDQAYIDFAQKPFLQDSFLCCNNVIVLQTLSKAWAGAALRIGMAFMDQELVEIFNKVKSPYNISQVNQEKAIEVLQNSNFVKQTTQWIIDQREFLSQELALLPLVKKVYPSDANFLLVVFLDATKVYNALLDKGILVRDRQGVKPGALRISVGTPLENKLVIQCLKNL